MAPNKFARPRAQIDFAVRTVKGSFGEHLLRGTHVDLYALAAERRIQRVEFGPIMADGRLLVTSDGFTVQLNDSERFVVDIKGPNRRRLSRKQRFTFAHEIAHTLFYDATHEPPQELPRTIAVIEKVGGRHGVDGIEDFCQIAAGVMLIPLDELKREVGRNGVASIEEVFRISDTFKVSAEVLLHRIAQTPEEESVRAASYGVLMVSTTGKKEQIRACVFSPALRYAVTPPRLYTGIRHWVKRNSLPGEILKSTRGMWPVPVQSRVLLIRKMPYGSLTDTWFLELKPES